MYGECMELIDLYIYLPCRPSVWTKREDSLRGEEFQQVQVWQLQSDHRGTGWECFLPIFSCSISTMVEFIVNVVVDRDVAVAPEEEEEENLILLNSLTVDFDISETRDGLWYKVSEISSRWSFVEERRKILVLPYSDSRMLVLHRLLVITSLAEEEQ